MPITRELVKADLGKNVDLLQVDSKYRLIIVAGLRSKQLLRGSQPRIEADPRRRKHTSIALEEIRQGLVHFTLRGEGSGDRNGQSVSGQASLAVE